MRQAVIIDAVRSPMGRGKPDGALSTLHPVDLLAQVLQALVARTGIDPSTVEDVLVGCVSQVGEQSATPGRMAWLAAGLPEHVPAATIDRKCGSSQQAAHFAAQGVIAGAYDVVIAAGVESMSRVRMGSARQQADPCGAGVRQRYPDGLVPQGVSAELVAARWQLGRDQLDECAARSHARAYAAAAGGAFAEELVPVAVPGRHRPAIVAADETIRPGTDPAVLATLPPAFLTPQLADRFPDVGWHITAGNSSQTADGASAVLIMSLERAEALGLRARARFHAFSQVGDDPLLMLTGPIPATRQALARAGISADEIDLYEVNEAFASVPLAWQQELGVGDDRLNVHGGAIALGHALGATGTRILTTLVNALERRGARWGLQAVCEAGGMANATVLERLA